MSHFLKPNQPSALKAKEIQFVEAIQQELDIIRNDITPRNSRIMRYKEILRYLRMMNFNEHTAEIFSHLCKFDSKLQAIAFQGTDGWPEEIPPKEAMIVVHKLFDEYEKLEKKFNILRNK